MHLSSYLSLWHSFQQVRENSAIIGVLNFLNVGDVNDLVDESRERAIDEDVGVARQSFLVISANLDSIFRCANKVVA